MFQVIRGAKRRNLPMWWAVIGGLVAGGAAMFPVLRKRALMATNLLKKDHLMVNGLIWTLQTTPSGNVNTRRTLFNQIRHQLELHTQVEEEIFYPAIRNLPTSQAQSRVEESYREHQTIKDLCNQIAGMDLQSSEFDSKVRDLKSRIDHHVKEEENELFLVAHRYLSNQQLEDLGMRMHNRKKDLKTRRVA